ncbi:hypothetical protein GUJ93_ZPchr0305g33725 [Zizania palustris]|uniref:Uncharacterized protein n=1 Tax=Zizania palustris TaxID=103762 RepID=A0A8J5UUF6_ZIZPA|nr:hypothetical protein GUJ93_ZPchr0305g33725 [Zizania palustris]
MLSLSVPSARLPLRAGPLRAPPSSCKLREGPRGPSPTLVVKPLACKAPASYHSALLLHRRRVALHPVAATATTTSKPVLKDTKKYKEWDSMTAKFAGAANIPFLLLQLPQIILNARNLLAGNKTALFAVPWLGMLTGLLGNLSLLSYFAKKKDGGCHRADSGCNLHLCSHCAACHGGVHAIATVRGHFSRCIGWAAPEPPQLLWVAPRNSLAAMGDFITIGGLAVLPQVTIRAAVSYYRYS